MCVMYALVCRCVCGCECVYLSSVFETLSVVVLNSGPQAPALYRFLFQPGPTKTNEFLF